MYGKEPEALRNVFDGFTLVLKDLPIEFVTDAFQTWLMTRREFPAPADIRALAVEARDIAASRIQSSARFTGVVFTQVIRDRDGGFVLAEYRQGDHKSDLELFKIFNGKRIRVSMRREGGV